MAPASVPAQGSDPVRTHVVKAGDTLWRLATDYLGDGHRWREILDLNRGVVSSEQDLPVGTAIRIPGRQRAAVSAPAKRPAPAAAAVPPPPTPAPASVPPPPVTSRPDTASPPPEPERPRVEPDTVSQVGAARPIPAGRTIFFGVKPGGGPATVRPPDSSGTAVVAEMRAALPAGLFEALSVPYVADPGTLSSAGTCLNLGGGQEAVEGAIPGGVLLHTVASLTSPAGVQAVDGARLALVRPGPFLPGLGRILTPTAIAKVVQHGAQVQAEIVAQFDVVSCTNAVVAANDIALPLDAKPAPVPAGPSGHVVWVGGDALLPTLQHVLVIDIGRAAGAHPGDRLTIYAEDGATPVATATVARVDALTASAIIVRQSRASIVTGLVARVTEKLP